MITKPRALATAAAVVIVAMVGGYSAFVDAPQTQHLAGGNRPIWAKVTWPFPLDLWGPGLAFRCSASHCGSDVFVYLRAKTSFCDCPSAIDDEMVDRVGDVDLVASERDALGAGRTIDVHSMKGRSRGYTVAGRNAGAKSALSIAFHNRCDLIVATAAIGSDQPSAQEAAVLDFLNSDLVLRWTEVTLGL